MDSTKRSRSINWEPEGSQIYSGINNADVFVADGNSAAVIMNVTSNPNLVNYYKFDETSCCNAYDTVTPSHSAYFYSGASFVSGKFGNAASFDGSNDYARNTNCNTVGGCNGYDHYSMSAWVNFDSFPTGTAYEGIANFRYDADAYLAVNSMAILFSELISGVHLQETIKLKLRQRWLLAFGII